MEISASLSALESAIVEMVWHTAKQAHASQKPGLIGGTPFHSTKAAANGSRKVKRPHTLMYSSSESPSRFITVLRSTWQSAATSARTSHTGARLAGASEKREQGVDHRARLLARQEVAGVRDDVALGARREAGGMALGASRRAHPLRPALPDHRPDPDSPRPGPAAPR